ncbi:hypothetical protein Ae201684_005524 [Aphanomyces euteiches]|uniref:Uncharacterized protein n=1 Tax=Aphanomyces euteiches TaxID=100861 RepID=A0A6G0XEZ4_9STRA|nr:hypothetical protein Ae201684_005524 [Aphanomyces euteiches]
MLQETPTAMAVMLLGELVGVGVDVVEAGTVVVVGVTVGIMVVVGGGVGAIVVVVVVVAGRCDVVSGGVSDVGRGVNIGKSGLSLVQSVPREQSSAVEQIYCDPLDEDRIQEPQSYNERTQV